MSRRLFFSLQLAMRRWDGIKLEGRDSFETNRVLVEHPEAHGEVA